LLEFKEGWEIDSLFEEAGLNWMSTRRYILAVSVKRRGVMSCYILFSPTFLSCPFILQTPVNSSSLSFDYTGLQGTHVEGVEPESSARTLRRSKLPASCMA